MFDNLRTHLNGAIAWFAKPQPCLLGRWLFLRLLSVCFFAAFWALRDQVVGLIGSEGLAPIAARWLWLRPTLSDRAIDSLLHIETLCGTILAALAILNIAPRATLATLTILWLICLSQLGPFDLYQPDAMLVSAGFCGSALAPASLFPGAGRPAPPTRIAQLAVFLLIVNIYWGSAIGKLQNPLWRSLHAFDHYFEAAPVPAWTGWYVHNHLSETAKQALCGSVTLIEGIAPMLLLFGRRRGRWCFFVLNTSLQMGIAITASYSFLNLLMIALGMMAITDKREPTAGEQRTKSTVLTRGVLALYLLATVVALCGRIVPLSLHPFRLRQPKQGSGHLVNTYGLYEDVGLAGYRIEIQSRNYGGDWETHRLRCLPPEDTARPSLVWPYQCRLDWLLWRETKHGYVADEIPLRALVQALLRGSDPVSSLFEPQATDAPPQRVRALVREMHFTTPAQHSLDGTWWQSRIVQTLEMD